MKQRNDLLNEVKDKLSNRYYLDQRDQELVYDCVDELLKAINYSQCCTELKVGKKAELNKLSDLLKEIEDDEEFKLNNPIEWGRRVGYLEGKINYICNL